MAADTGLDGKYGKVLWGTNASEATWRKVTSWRHTQEQEARETTGMSDSPHKKFVAGLQSGNFAFTCNWDTTDAQGEPPVITDLNDGTKDVVLQLYCL